MPVRRGGGCDDGIGMNRRGVSRRAAVGVTEQGNAVVLVTVSADGRLLDRRRVVLTHGLPTHPHHHEGSWAVGRYLSSKGARPLPLSEALALVAQVRGAAEAGAGTALDAVAATIGMPVEAVAIRTCASIPATIEARIRDHRAQTMADSVMYREAVAAAASSRGCAVSWYDGAGLLGDETVAPVIARMGRTAGVPWQAAHRQAAAAALAALRAGGQRLLSQ